MKRLLLLLPLLLLVSATPFKVQNILYRSVQNERDTVAKYEACAVKADQEGYPGAAALFRAAARAEGVHAARMIEAMKARGIDVPQPAVHNETIGTTAENLRAAALAETQERDSVYKEAIATAGDANDQELVTLFDQTRDTEVEHANLFHTAARQLEQYKEPKHYYVCDKCGYTTDVSLPMCALCRNRHPHEVE